MLRCLQCGFCYSSDTRTSFNVSGSANLAQRVTYNFDRALCFCDHRIRIDSIKYSLEEIGFSSGKETERAHQTIGKTVNTLRSGPLKITAELIAGRRVRQIVARARDWNADLIVVGTEERTGLKRLMSRGTAIAIANRAHCSVRVVRRNSVSHKQLSLGPIETEQDKSAVYGSGSLRNAA